jgi:hypothetical protein
VQQQGALGRGDLVGHVAHLADPVGQRRRDDLRAGSQAGGAVAAAGVEHLDALAGTVARQLDEVLDDAARPRAPERQPGLSVVVELDLTVEPGRGLVRVAGAGHVGD